MIQFILNFISILGREINRSIFLLPRECVVRLCALRKARLTLAYLLLCPASRLLYPNVAVLVCCGEALSRIRLLLPNDFSQPCQFDVFYRGSYSSIEGTANRLMTLFCKLSDHLLRQVCKAIQFPQKSEWKSQPSKSESHIFAHPSILLDALA
jgi:hypothetical protein